MATIKQRKAVKKILENHGNVSKAMRESGYSKNTAKNPKELTESKGYLEIFNELISDDTLSKKHRQLLEDDNAGIQIKALDLAYKVKGDYAPEKKQTVNLNMNTEIKNSQESRDLVEEYEEKVANMLRQKKC
ncbi:MAG: hypothetical protein OEV44_01140 [Spirochaetota bacterium]|nr:hypothetical protein [Spirochaetota bacterium]